MAAVSGPSRSEIQRKLVLDQLDRLLSDSLFKNSKRYPTLLRYVVEETLENRADLLKERSVGVAVFGRDADYDTNLDPVVRVTAGEIRKRIARYYSQPAHLEELRIELAAGSYVPEFRFPPEPAAIREVPPPVAPPRRRLSLRSAPVYLAGACALAGIVALAAWLRPWAPRTPLDDLWAPILDSPNAVLMCVGQTQFIPPGQNVTVAYMAEPDVEMLSNLVGFLGARGKPFAVRGETGTNLADLRRGPAVLIGAFNNEWTVRLLSGLRFSFQRDHSIRFIQDRQNASLRAWASDESKPYASIDRDFGLISRVLDPRTDRIVLVAAGLRRYGTAAAGEFLTDPKYMRAAAAQAPADWQHRNFQIVVATNVINGNSAPPRLVTMYFW